MWIYNTNKMLRSIQRCRTWAPVFWRNTICNSKLKARMQAASYSSARVPECPDQEDSRVKLVIFDKDGTLIDIHHTWAPWCEELVEKLVLKSGKVSRDILYKSFGYVSEKRKFGHGLINDTDSKIISGVSCLLRDAGHSKQEADYLLDECFIDSVDQTSDVVCPIDEPSDLVNELKELGIKVAVCTSDNHANTQQVLDALGIAHQVDMTVCGDTPGSKPKPDPHNLRLICSKLGIELNEAVMVGDSTHDVLMGRYAGLGSVIGVLSGTCDKRDLEDAHHIIPSVGYMMPKILPNRPVSGGVLKGTGPHFQQQRSLSSIAQRHCYSTNSVDTYDYIIVGAGSAGCVVANRLSANQQNKVLVLEAGPEDKTWKIHMPAALMYTLFDPTYNYCYWTTPQKHMNNRSLYWPRARVWGGCSSHNAMVYVRGNALDFDGWEAAGAKGWSYADCLPYFKRSQTHEYGENDYRGGNGFCQVTRGTGENPLHQAFLDAAQQAGYPFTDDMNGYQQEGFGWMDMAIWDGRRSNASNGFLRPALCRPNLNIASKANAHKLLFEGKRAVGVSYKQGGIMKEVRCAKEVILSSGGINSPQLLMLSGVGPADHLKAMDIEVVHHLPGIGQNLQDHLEVYVQHECKLPITLYSYQWKFPHMMIKTGIEWFLSKTGPAASTHLDTGGFIRSRPGIEYPDIQYHFLPSVIINHGASLGDCHAYQVHVGPMRSKSRGQVTLASKDPDAHPLMDANYLSEPDDLVDFRHCVRLSKEILAQQAFDKYRGREILPGSDATSDAQIDAYIRSNADSAYHPSCTAKMGSADDKMAVVDPSCRVYGMEGLRIVDASIMPNVTTGNLNAPVTMLAEKAADIILGNTPLPKSTAPVFRAKDIQSQR